MKQYYKEYNFIDWTNLYVDIRRDIQNNCWTPFEPNIGENTRKLILDEFIRSIGDEFYVCEFGYFSHYVIGIKYIPKDSKKKIPNDFHGIIINKGKIIEQMGNDIIKVGWRHSGKELIKIIK
ncbi:hypothetical protein [Flavobacterium lacus]|uniref:Uncharacterized protein n=1 Tax=Flavobacterium lacus TaxID=1353778 RepID=A0A328WP18_9FLAO|nr:hypothetical protein [Flavobacterium lacus]RAR48052.1 hypothetical protein B0I10_10653 [Flavobacterium lacus]